MGSNPTRGMDVCLGLFCLCCSVQVSALLRTDHPSKRVPPTVCKIYNFRINNSECKQATDPNPSKKKGEEVQADTDGNLQFHCGENGHSWLFELRFSRYSVRGLAQWLCGWLDGRPTRHTRKLFTCEVRFCFYVSNSPHCSTRVNSQITTLLSASLLCKYCSKYYSQV
jgi:hypothetical protein